MPFPTPTPRERDLEIFVADLRQAATDLWRELQETKAAVPTAVDCTTLSGEALYELGVAVLRACRAERAAGASGYCAQPCGRSTYCAHHRAIIYRPSAPVSDAGYRGATP